MDNSIFVFICSFLELITICYIIKILNGSDKLDILMMMIFCSLGAVLVSILDYIDMPYQLTVHILYYFISFYLMTKDKIYSVITDVFIANVVLFIWQMGLSILVNTVLNISVQCIPVQLVLLVISAISFICLSKSLKLDRYIEKVYRVNKSIILWGSFNVVIIICIIADIWDDKIFVIWNNLFVIICVVALYVISNIIIVISWIRIKSVKKKNNGILKYTEYLRNIVDIYNRREHEYKNQINAVISIAENSRKEDVAGKIMGYCHVILENEREKNRLSVISDNTMIAAFILRTEKLTKSLGINFEYIMNSPCPEYRISEFDMLEILSNLVNNAVEAVMVQREEHRNITVIFDTDEIEVINDYIDADDDIAVSDFFRKEYSSKGKGRGYGLPNVMDIAKKNKAKFSMSYENGMIIASIKLNPPES